MPWTDVKPGGELSTRELNELAATVDSLALVRSQSIEVRRGPGGFALEARKPVTLMARTTSLSGSGADAGKYAWEEIYFDTDGTVVVPPGGQKGTVTSLPARDITGRTDLALNTIIEITLDPTGSFYTFLANTLTVKETDSTPTYSSIHTLEFDEDRGAIVTQPADGRAMISWGDAYGTLSTAPGAVRGPGLISADGNDQYLGDGYKYSDGWCGGIITIDTVMRTAGYMLAAGAVAGGIGGAGAFCTVTGGSTVSGGTSLITGGMVKARWGLVSRDFYPGYPISLFYIDPGVYDGTQSITYGIVAPDGSLKEGVTGSLAKCQIFGGLICGGSSTIDINSDTTGTLDIGGGGTGLNAVPPDGSVLSSDGSAYQASAVHVLAAKWTVTV